MNKKEKLGHYQIGLNREKEAVISAHFMHALNHDSSLKLYNEKQFIKNRYSITPQFLFEKVIPVLLEASERFVGERAQAAILRAKTNYKTYHLKSPEEVKLPEVLTEVMLDRQFLKGPKTNYSQTLLWTQMKDKVRKNKPINMVIPALPYKSSSPLKTRGGLPDFSEVNFLLGLSEIAKTINYLYHQYKPGLSGTFSKFMVVCDGNRFNNFTNELEQTVDKYEKYLRIWIKKLKIDDFIEITDYKSLINNNIPQHLKREKNLIREKEVQRYKQIFIPLLDPYNMQRTLSRAIKEDPDPEESNTERRFVPLFKSLIYIIRYKVLEKYTKDHKKNYISLYQELTRHIFYPYLTLDKEEFDSVSFFVERKDTKFQPTQEQVLEYLRYIMLQEAWEATIAYIAEIKSDRDLYSEPILACVPEYIRWTIHTKPGQLAVLTTTASGDPVQAWHGVGVFKLSQKNKIKLYALPVLSLEGNDAVPVTISGSQNNELLDEYEKNKQPIFYVYDNINFKDGHDFLDKIKKFITRKRKF